MFSKLGKGERTCLAVAFTQNSLLATDDKLARRVAQQHGILFIGTVGVLKASVQHQLLSQRDAQRKLKEMIAAGYYSPVLKLDFE
jgi:predicted nucleic acid-binding protein